MPLSVKKVGDKYRVVGPDGKPETNKKGTPVDGGGFESKKDAIKQMVAINISKTQGSDLRGIEQIVITKINAAIKVTE